jgi:DNA invertase Pin-like site-specific DNA recombinase
MSERARLWQRVSTAGQDEENQLPDLIRWSDTHGYQSDLEERYIVKGKSAYHKKQEAALEQAISDMANGQYTVLVVWAFDRIQRGSTLDAFMLAEKVRAAGGRIEYVLDTHLNEVNEMSDVLLTLTATAARQESKRKSDRVKVKFDRLRAGGSAIGRPPFGYDVRCGVCDAPSRRPGCNEHKKVFKPNAEGRRFAPAIFQMVIDGDSLRDVAVWLTAEGADGKVWHQDSLSRDIIRNPLYYGRRRNGGQLEAEALVTYSIWQQANAALSSRYKAGRGAKEKALLRPVCGNPKCDATGEHCSPMYRLVGRSGNRKVTYYRCHGRGPQSKGCGNMILLAELDALVIEAMEADQMDPHADRVFIPGDDRSDEIGRLRDQGAEAMKCGDYAAATECMRQAEKLEASPRVAPHWERLYTCYTCGTVKEEAPCVVAGHVLLTESEYFASLDTDGRRRELAENWIVSAYRSDGEIVLTIVHKSFT